MSNPYSPSYTQGFEPEIVHFDGRKALSDGWEIFKRHLGVAMGIAMVWLVGYVFAANSCLGLVVLPHLFAGYSMAALALARNRPKFDLIFSAFDTFGPVLTAGLIFAVVYTAFVAAILIVFFVAAFLVGFWGAALQVKNLDEVLHGDHSDTLFLAAFLAISAVAFLIQFYVMARLQLVFPLILEKKMEAMEAFRTSWRMTAGAAVSLTGIKFLFDFILPIAGIVLCCIPALFAYPLALTVQGAILAQYMGPGEMAENAMPPVAPQITEQPSPPAPPAQPSAPETPPPTNPYG